jgi:hypothetical protein
MNQMNALAAIVAGSLAVFGTASMSGAQQAGSNEDESAIRKVIVEMTEGSTITTEELLRVCTRRTLDSSASGVT